MHAMGKEQVALEDEAATHNIQARHTTGRMITPNN
jgi:hypothetical protein